MQGIFPNLCLVGTCALLKLAWHLLSGHNATPADGQESREMPGIQSCICNQLKVARSEVSSRDS